MPVQPVVLPGHSAAESLTLLRTAAPLVHCLTNEVVQSFTANVLLALGASPAMVVEPEEAAQFVDVADALLINIGTLHRTRAPAMEAAIHAARDAGRPWVLDPVAVGGLTYRTQFARRLLACKPTAIRGNASEIMALAGIEASGRGVDSANGSLQALPAAYRLACETESVVAVTGEVDYITDGDRCFAVPGGDKLMTRVVGTGCALSAVVAAFSVQQDKLTAVASACMVMARAGENACAQANGPGSFPPAFLDALYHLSGDDLRSAHETN